MSDALLNLDVPGAGLLPDIAPIPSRHGSSNRLVAPISTVTFVPHDHEEGDGMAGEPDLAGVNRIPVAESSNMPKDRHFTDVAPPGSVVIMQQPRDQTVALLGDIVATRYKIRGIRGVFVDGRTRDIVGIGEVCKDGSFQAWTKGLSSVGTSAEVKPWSVDELLSIGNVDVEPGDILCADEAEMVCCVIPKAKLDDVLALLPVQKEADDGLLRDVQDGMDFKTAILRHPNHYTVKH